MQTGAAPATDPAALLALWECGIVTPPASRGEALVEAAWPAAPIRSLGERNARLLALHARLFGRDVDLISRCPACGTVAQFTGDCEQLAEGLRPSVELPPSHRLESCAHAIEFRLPSSGDVAIASADIERFPEILLDRCILECTRDGAPVPPRELPVPVLDALSRRMEALDPGASVSFAVSCPQCRAAWTAPLDVAEMLWRTMQAAAERLLLDIDTLARAYGWTEAEVLRLSPLRRAAYLQLVTA